jgi:hypothetical protein
MKLNPPMAFRPRRSTLMRLASALPLAVVMLAWTGAAAPASAHEDDNHGKGKLRVMTYNVDEGTDYIEALSATTFPQFLAGVTTDWNNVQATNPPERAQAIARQIGKARPTLVSLEELTQWRTCPTVDFQTCAAPQTLQYDLLQLIMDALHQQGQPYKVVVTTTAFDVAAPCTLGLIVEATNHIAILARTDLDADELQLSNVQTAQFLATFTPSILGNPLPIHRAWASVDVTFHETNFRYIAAHLESFDPAVQAAQGQELLSGPANTSLPVVIAMDSNSKANPPSDATTATYEEFINGGFTDAWTATNEDEPGLTCCQDPLLRNPVSIVNERIDLILVRGALGVKDADLFGGKPADRTPSGLWPSDHIGIAARLTRHSEENDD